MNPSLLSETVSEIKLKLQAKGFKQQDLKSFFFNPFKKTQNVTIKELKSIFERTGVDESNSLLLARYIIEQQIPG